MHTLKCGSTVFNAPQQAVAPNLVDFPNRCMSPFEPSTTSSGCYRRVTIEKLSDEVLLNVFRYYLDAFPRLWPRLVHVCRKWRRIVFAFQRVLHLRLFCTHGTPVLTTLDCWPVLPIVVEYGGSPALDPPAPKDEANVIAALKQSDRVISIHLTVTMSLLLKLPSIEGPFSNLEDLVLMYQDYRGLGLPNTFRWGPRLRRLHSTGINFFAPLQQLSSSKDLVDIQLHHTVVLAYFPPEALANALSGMTQLQSLSLNVHSFNPRQYRDSLSDSGMSLISQERIILPALTHLKFQGTSKSFDRFMVRIDPPFLGDIDITIIGHRFDSSRLCEFINRIEIQKSHHRVDILSSKHAISISFTQPEAPTRLKLQVRQLSYMAQICKGLSPSLLGVEHLHISATPPSSEQDDSGEWLKLIYPFRASKWVYVAGDRLTNIVLASQHSEMLAMRGETVLPTLHKLCIRTPESHYAPWQEAVASFTYSRQLSGHPVGVEYERPWINELRGIGPFSQRVTIEMLSDDDLLNIFHYHMLPQSWPTLTHVCQRWRQVVLRSPLGLRLRLYCTYGTPVVKNLKYWPPFPLVVNYVGSSVLDPLPAPEDEENIMAALKQSNRVSSISLTVTKSLLESLSTIANPFSELEELVLQSRENLQLTLPVAFRWGPHLRTLYLTRVAIPTLPRLLSPSTDLVDLQLHEIPRVGYFSPESFANALVEMTHLRSLSLHFLSSIPRRKFLALHPPSGERVVLSALTCLKYRGTSKYLDSLVARIDAPHLEDIDITFFSQPTMDASQLGQFIDRIETLNSHRKVDVLTSEHAISISFAHPNAPKRVELRVSCGQLDWQLSSITQICGHFSPFLSRVEDLGIYTTQPSAMQDDDTDGEHWVDLIRAFGGAKDFRVGGHMTGILGVLSLADGERSKVLPALRSLHVPELGPMHGPLWGAVESFTSSRRLSGHSVEVLPSLNIPSPQVNANKGKQNTPQQYTCTACNVGFTNRQGLNKHNGDEHMPRNVCPHCGVFKWSQARNYLFRKHLESKHPEVAHTNALISESNSPL